MQHRAYSKADIAAARQFLATNSAFDPDAFERTSLETLYAEPLGPTKVCCSVDELATWLLVEANGPKLSNRRRAELEGHLSECPVCSENLAVYRRLGARREAVEMNDEVTVEVIESKVVQGEKRQLLELVLGAAEPIPTIACRNVASAMGLTGMVMGELEFRKLRRKAGRQSRVGFGVEYVMRVAVKPCAEDKNSRGGRARRGLVNLKDLEAQLERIRGKSFRLVRPDRMSEG
jgi:hypothetical protein